MSTLRANNLTRQSGSGVPDLGGVAANRLLPTAWVNFNGTGVVAIRDQQNVSSITDNAVGDYSINFTNAMANTNYAVAGVCQIAAATAAFLCAQETTGFNVAYFRARLTDATNPRDSTAVSVVIFGGQA